MIFFARCFPPKNFGASCGVVGRSVTMGLGAGGEVSKCTNFLGLAYVFYITPLPKTDLVSQPEIDSPYNLHKRKK